MIEYNDKINFIIYIFNKNKYLCFIKIMILISIITITNRKNLNNFFKQQKMGSYKLYNVTSIPQISLLLFGLETFIFDEESLNSLIKNIRIQTIKNIQIIFYISKEANLKIINLIKHYSQIDERIELYFYNNKLSYNSLNEIFNRINGRYTLIIKTYIKLKKEDLKKYYNFTNGKINNYYNFTTKNNNKLFLIRTKILLDICDNNIFFRDYYSLLNYIFLLPKPSVNYISISFCPNNRYVPLLYVSITSILISKELYSYISFYIIIPEDFSVKNMDFLYSLYDQYDFFNITFIKMDTRYDKAFISRYITTHAYYRFSLGEFLPNLNKIIYLDTDTICFKDLTNFYNLNFKGKMILGQVIITNNNKKRGYFSINSGILLLNLKEMRRLNVEQKVLNIIKKGYKNKFHDQGIINKFFHKYVGIFPPQYHSRLFFNYNEIVNYNKKSGEVYDNDYLYFAWKYPAIRHFVAYTKPNYNNKYNKEDWWYFARQSLYFDKKTPKLSNIFHFR